MKKQELIAVLPALWLQEDEFTSTTVAGRGWWVCVAVFVTCLLWVVRIVLVSYTRHFWTSSSEAKLKQVTD